MANSVPVDELLLADELDGSEVRLDVWVVAEESPLQIKMNLLM
jgi:hypothetical protein